MKKLFIVLGALLLVGLMMPRQTMAQAQQDSVALDLDKILEIALSDNPDIQVADRTIEIQKYAKKETITGLFPKVDLSAQGVKNLKVATMVMNMGGQTITVRMGQPYNYSATAQAALPLFAPQLWKSVSLSEEQVKLAVEQARESKINTIASVKNAYYSLLLARESYEALMAGYKTAERNVEDTKKSFEQGLVSEYDKLTADVQLAGIKPNLLAAQNGIKLAEMQLKVLMGVDVNEPLRFTGRLEDFEEGLFADLMNLKADTDLSDNSAIRQLDYNARILRLSEKINKLGYLPTLALAISGGYTAMPQEFNPFKATYFGSLTLALSFSWTIFDSLQKYMKTKQNRLTLENLEQQRENALRQLELSVAASLNSIETAAEQVVSNKENVYAAERAFMISEKRYEVGSGTQLERNSSESNLLQARLQYVQSIYDFLSNRATLEKTLGKVVMD